MNDQDEGDGNNDDDERRDAVRLTVVAPSPPLSLHGHDSPPPPHTHLEDIIETTTQTKRLREGMVKVLGVTPPYFPTSSHTSHKETIVPTHRHATAPPLQQIK